MLLSLDEAGVPMKVVYQLEKELQADPQRVQLTQALTLNRDKPTMGLKGTHGLFGSAAWWDSIRSRKMPLLFLSGVVQDAYVAGQDDSDLNNTIDLKLPDGSVQSVGIYVNNPEDARLFAQGCRAMIVYALDELKKQPSPTGGKNYSKVALEMAVSIDQVT